MGEWVWKWLVIRYAKMKWQKWLRNIMWIRRFALSLRVFLNPVWKDQLSNFKILMNSKMQIMKLNKIASFKSFWLFVSVRTAKNLDKTLTGQIGAPFGMVKMDKSCNFTMWKKIALVFTTSIVGFKIATWI